MPDENCYHCGLPVPSDADFPVTIKGEARVMCCPGCQAVATAIVEGGLESFYQFRAGASATPELERPDFLAHYDLPEVQADFVDANADGTATVDLSVSGITCSACAWLIEHHLQRLEGVVSVSVNVSSHRARVTWRPDVLKLSRLFTAFDEIGYEARPAGDSAAEQQRIKENKVFLLRLGIAGLGMMQTGMVAIALYAGGFHGIEAQWQHLLRWVSLIIVTPVVLFSARPFYSAAIRSLKIGRLVMDVPVSLAITLAFGASIWATITNSGEVYFDSVSMFTFFLLLGRYLEMRVRHRNENYAGNLSRLIPPVATRIVGDDTEIVPVKSLNAGDIVLVRSGETLPCDGEVLNGASNVVEAILTGEQNPVGKRVGDAVSAGTVNLENPLELRVSAIGLATRLAAILNLVEEAQAVKPRRAALADRLSGWFVAAVLVIATGVALAWSFIDPERALWISLSVLVVTCPCALSLATPAALTVATGELRKRGFLIRKPHVLEALAEVDHCILDKTGTLTEGRMRIVAVRPMAAMGKEQVLAIAASLERGTTHPIARAFKSVVAATQPVSDHRVVIGGGVTGTIDGESYALGKVQLLSDTFGYSCPADEEAGGIRLYLGSVAGCIAEIDLVDELRPGANEAVAELEQLGVRPELLSGDKPVSAATVAAETGISHWRGGATPEDKLAHVRALQARGKRVMMVGDGINDVPVLSGADVSVAMGDAVDLTRLHADSLLISGNLAVLPLAVEMARKTGRIIRQNLAWALIYNVLALPLAALGYIPPWAAAIGMSASSLLVVVNALRLSRSGGAAPLQPGV